MLSNLMLRESVSDTIPIFTEERTEACLKGLFKITADMHQGQYLNLGQPAVTNHAGLTLSHCAVQLKLTCHCKSTMHVCVLSHV